MITSTKSVSSIYGLIQNHPSIPKVFLSLQLQYHTFPPPQSCWWMPATSQVFLFAFAPPAPLWLLCQSWLAPAMAVTLGRGKEGLEGVCPPWLINVGLAEGASIMGSCSSWKTVQHGGFNMFGPKSKRLSWWNQYDHSPWRMEKQFGNKGNIWSNQPVGHSPHSQRLCNSYHQPRLLTAASKHQSTYRANGPWCQQHVPSGVGWSCLLPTGPGLWMMWA